MTNPTPHPETPSRGSGENLFPLWSSSQRAVAQLDAGEIYPTNPSGQTSYTVSDRDLSESSRSPTTESANTQGQGET